MAEQTAIPPNSTNDPVPMNSSPGIQIPPNPKSASKVSHQKHESGNSKDQVVSILRIFLIISSLIAFSLINTAIVKDEFIVVETPMKSFSNGLALQFDVEKIYPKVGTYEICSHDEDQEPTEIGQLTRNFDKFEKYELLNRLNEKIRKDVLSALRHSECDKQQMISAIIRRERSALKEKNEYAYTQHAHLDGYQSRFAFIIDLFGDNIFADVIKEELSFPKYRKVWARACLGIMIAAAVFEAVSIALAIVSFMKPRLKLLMIVIIVISVLVLIFSATAIVLYGVNSDEDKYLAKQITKIMKQESKGNEKPNGVPANKDQEIKKIKMETDILNGISIVNLASSIVLCIVNIIMAVYLLLRG